MTPRVVIVEDERLVATELELRLEGLGYQVVAVTSSGEGAIRAVDEHAPDLILVDIQLRGHIDGIETATRIRRTHDVAIVYLTAYTDDDTLERAKATEPAGYIVKPFTAEMLRVTLHIAVSNRRLRLERQQALDAKRTADAMYGEILKNTTDAVISIDKNGSIIVFSPGAQAIFGYTEDEVLGQPLEMLLPPEHHPAHRVHATQFTTSHEASRAMGARLPVQGMRRSGAVFPADVTISKHSVDGMVIRTAILRDISARKSLEYQLQHAIKLQTIGQLSGSVAHDFNNLLTVVLGTARLLRRAPPTEVEEFAQQLEDVGLRGSALTRQLLAQVRRDPEPQIESVDVCSAVGAIRPLLQRLAGRRVRVEFDVPDETGFVRLAYGQLDQCLFNLIANARDAIRDEGRITVAARLTPASPKDGLRVPADAFVDLTVRDDGMGMRPEVLGRCTEAFYTTKPNGSGTGLGLATVNRIVQGVGGVLLLDSTPGEGTAVTMRFPATTARAERQAASDPTALHRGSVMVVDSDDYVRKTVARCLMEEGFGVLQSRTADQALALERAYQRPIDVLLIDLLLPGAKALELANELRKRRPGSRVVFTVGNHLSSSYQSLPAELRRSALRKPFSVEALIRALAA